MNYGGGGHGGYGGPPGAPPGGGHGGPPPGYGAPPPGYAPAGQAPQAGPYGAPQAGPYGAPQQQPYGAPQQPYGAPQQPYGAPQQPFGGAMPGQQVRQQHPKAMTALVLGGVSWFLGLWLICSVPAWIIGANALKEIRANPHLYTGESEAKIGMWLGIVHTVLGAVAIIFAILFLVLFAAAASVG
ncbi:MAG: DUF4190 domain-containing protein [Deltaproteobacteria bacterium]|nr:DUF4190 domain-containing protein [Deltaproteobacteria bacterium]